MSADDFRVEHDTMGEVRVPASARWGAQTQRAVENFPVSGMRVERSLISALAALKGRAALVNHELGVIADDVAQAIHDAARLPFPQTGTVRSRTACWFASALAEAPVCRKV